MSINLKYLLLRLSLISLVLFVITIGIATSMDFHEQCRQKDECPLCRFQVDGNAPIIQIAQAGSCHITWSLFISPLPQTSPVKTVKRSKHLPNAPPAA